MKHKIYYFDGAKFCELNGSVKDLDVVKKIVNDHIPSQDYYFISTISPISGEDSFSGRKEDLTYLYLRNKEEFVKLNSLS